MKRIYLRLLSITLWGLLLVSLAAGVFFAYQYFSLRTAYQREQQAMTQGLAKYYIEQRQPIITPTARPLSTESPSAPKPTATELHIEDKQAVNPNQQAFEQANAQLIIDHAALLTANVDYRAWIYAPAVEVSLPVLKSPDNEHYLRFDFDERPSYLGSIFFDYRSNTEFQDKNTIIYGHNLDNGAMFSNLVRYKHQSFLDQNPYVWIYTPEAIYRIDVAYGLIVDPRDQRFLRTNFRSDKSFQEFLAEAANLSLVKARQSPSADDQIVTLYTCTNDVSQSRFILVGTLVKLGTF